jgi:hypothetical protein
VSKKFDKFRYEEDGYGEQLHRDKKKVQRGKKKYFDEVDFQPRNTKPLRRYNKTY